MKEGDQMSVMALEELDELIVPVELSDEEQELLDYTCPGGCCSPGCGCSGRGGGCPISC
jgi:hypothetical protein